MCIYICIYIYIYFYFIYIYIYIYACIKIYIYIYIYIYLIWLTICFQSLFLGIEVRIKIMLRRKAIIFSCIRGIRPAQTIFTLRVTETYPKTREQSQRWLSQHFWKYEEYSSRPNYGPSPRLCPRKSARCKNAACAAVTYKLPMLPRLLRIARAFYFCCSEELTARPCSASSPWRAQPQWANKFVSQ